MDTFSLPIPSVVITASVASLGVFIAWRNRQSERVKLTRDLYNQFFTLTQNRSEAWFWLEELDDEIPARSFEQIWRVKDQRSFMNLYKVVAFWFLLYTLYEADQLDKTLAKSLFQYEFQYWQEKLYPLTKRTKGKEGEIFPDVLKPFESTKWLLLNEITTHDQV
jgi:hypothetical protein